MKLIPKELAEKIPKLYEQDGKGYDAIVYAKLFHPLSNWTWYVTEYDGEDIAFGLVQGFETELGYFSIKELESVNVRGIGVERDLLFCSSYLREYCAKR